MAARTPRYRLEKRLGIGGMAEVFRGVLHGAEGFSRPVAIKRVLPGFSDDPTFEAMFKNEARIASLLLHPNIVSVIDFDRDEDGRFFIVMELVEGKDLHALVERGPIPVPVSAFIVCEVLRALAFAHGLHHEGHAMNVVHRDVSPHNVLLSWSGGVKLGDFGIAKAVASRETTRSGMIKGKAAYLSPEQIACRDLDGRSDLFSLGIIFHELLCGRRLFGVREGAPDPVIIHRIANLEIPRPTGCSDGLAAVCMRLLERDRERRFPTAGAALEALLRSDEITVRGPNALADLLEARFPNEAPGSGSFRAHHERTRTDRAPISEPSAPSIAFPPPVTTPSPRPNLPYGGFSLIDIEPNEPPPAPRAREAVPSGETALMAPPSPAASTPTAWRPEIAAAPIKTRPWARWLGLVVVATAAALPFVIEWSAGPKDDRPGETLLRAPSPVVATATVARTSTITAGSIEPSAEPQIEPSAEPKIEPNAEPQIEPNAEPQIEPTPAPAPNANANAKAPERRPRNRAKAKQPANADEILAPEF